MEEFERVIEVTDKISIHIKIDDRIDLATAASEAVMLTKIAKAVESVQSVEGLTKEAETKVVERVRCTHEDYIKKLKEVVDMRTNGEKLANNFQEVFGRRIGGTDRISLKKYTDVNAENYSDKPVIKHNGKLKQGKYSPDEMQVIKDNYGKASARKIAEMLHRPVNAVANKVWQMTQQGEV